MGSRESSPGTWTTEFGDQLPQSAAHAEQSAFVGDPDLPALRRSRVQLESPFPRAPEQVRYEQYQSYGDGNSGHHGED